MNKKPSLIIIESTQDNSRPQYHMQNEIENVCKQYFDVSSIKISFKPQSGRSSSAFVSYEELQFHWLNLQNEIIETIQEVFDEQEKVVILWIDGFNPAVISVKAMLSAMRLDHRVVMASIFHGSPNISHDSFDDCIYLKKIDQTIWQSYDLVFIARKYLKKYLPESTKVSVLNWLPIDPLVFDVVPKETFERDNVIIFPHRWCKEKNNEKFLRLLLLRELNGVILTPVPIPENKLWPPNTCEKIKRLVIVKLCSRREYLSSLASSKWVYNENLYETFGIATMEALILGCKLYQCTEFESITMAVRHLYVDGPNITIRSAMLKQHVCLKKIIDKLQQLANGNSKNEKD